VKQLVIPTLKNSRLIDPVDLHSEKRPQVLRLRWAQKNAPNAAQDDSLFVNEEHCCPV
jgi:hypothetical protein